MKKRIAVIMGGPNKGHEDSLSSGRNIILNLDNDRYEGVPIIVSKEGEWDVDLDELRHHADISFINVFGEEGEGGLIQHELDLREMPYIGSDPHSSALGLNKFASLWLLRNKGFNVPRMRHVNKIEWLEKSDLIVNELSLLLGFPMVIKPNRGSLGSEIIFLKDDFKLRSSLEKLFEKNKDVLVQEYIRGREFICGVCDHGIKDTAHPLLPIEVNGREVKGFPDYLPEPVLDLIRKTANRVHSTLGFRSISKVDMILTKDNNLFILEANTVPDFRDGSSLIHSSEKLGISFNELLHRLIQSSERSFNERKQK